MLEDTFKVASIARVAGVILLTVRVFRVSQENFSDKTCLEDATTFKRSIFTKDLFPINQRSDWHWLKKTYTKLVLLFISFHLHCFSSTCIAIDSELGD